MSEKNEIGVWTGYYLTLTGYVQSEPYRTQLPRNRYLDEMLLDVLNLAEELRPRVKWVEGVWRGVANHDKASTQLREEWEKSLGDGFHGFQIRPFDRKAGVFWQSRGGSSSNWIALPDESVDYSPRARAHLANLGAVPCVVGCIGLSTTEPRPLLLTKSQMQEHLDWVELQIR